MGKNISFLDSRFFNGAAVVLALAACGWTVLNFLSVLLAVSFFGAIVVISAIVAGYYWQAAGLAWFSALSVFLVLVVTIFHVRKAIEEQTTAAA